MERSSWSSEELDAIVADYFAMLRDEIRGVSYNKSVSSTARTDQSSSSIATSLRFSRNWESPG